MHKQNKYIKENTNNLQRNEKKVSQPKKNDF